MLSFVIGCVLWFIVLGSRNMEISKDVPIEFMTAPDMVIANDVPDKAVFNLSGPKAFLRNILNRKEEPIRINFANTRPGLVPYRLIQDNIQVPIGVKVVSVSPSVITAKLEMIKKKEVPVKLITQGTYPQGFVVQKMELLQNTIKIKGPESKLDAINVVSTMPLNLSEIKESGVREIKVDIAAFPSVSIEGSHPKIEYIVSHTTANFKIRPVYVKVLANRKYKVEPEDVTVYVKCSQEELAILQKKKFVAVADARNMSPGNYSLVLNIELPGSVKIVRVMPAKVNVTVY